MVEVFGSPDVPPLLGLHSVDTSTLADRLPSLRNGLVLMAKNSRVLQDYPGKYLTCRTRGHVWKMKTDPRDIRVGVVILSKCVNCPAEVTEVWKHDGELDWRQYHYPDDYLVEGTLELRRRHFRKELIRRATKGEL